MRSLNPTGYISDKETFLNKRSLLLTKTVRKPLLLNLPTYGATSFMNLWQTSMSSHIFSATNKKKIDTAN